MCFVLASCTLFRRLVLGSGIVYFFQTSRYFVQMSCTLFRLLVLGSGVVYFVQASCSLFWRQGTLFRRRIVVIGIVLLGALKTKIKPVLRINVTILSSHTLI